MFPALAVTTPSRELLVGRLQDRVAGAADLERVDRLQRLELQLDLGVARRRRAGTSGVRTATPASTSRAARISASGITARRPVPASSASARAQHVLGGGEVLDREPERLEHRQLVASSAGLRPRRSAARRARRGCAPAPIAPSRSGNEVVAGLVDRRLAPVDEERGRRHRRRVELARRRDARPDRVDVRAGLQPAALERSARRATSP